MSDKPYPYNEDQLAWLRDLETTEELQTAEWLHYYDPHLDVSSFCCLGRACVVLGIEGIKGERSSFTYECEDTLLPLSVENKLRLYDSGGQLVESFYEDGVKLTCLTDLNDNAGWSFKKIAAYIRANPWNVFRDPEDAA